MLVGTIVENSLADKSVLKKLKITSSRQAGDWTLHEVQISEGQVRELGKNFTNEPWYAHFWEPGKDEIIVVFKDKMFTIRHSDKSTWSGAVAYGKSIGIPDEQLDFVIP